MPRYLSPEWIADLDATAQASPGLQEATKAVSLCVQHDVTGGPNGDVSFHVVAEHGSVHVKTGPAADPTVTFSQDYETAVAVARGELSAQAAFMVGALRVEGDLPRLVTEHGALTGLDDVFATVRGRTDY